MGEIVDLDEHRPCPTHVCKVTCRACGHHWVGCVPEVAPRDELQCPSCEECSASVTHFLAAPEELVERNEAGEDTTVEWLPRMELVR